jgi:hypothetical protein
MESEAYAMNDILEESHTILQTTPLRWANLAESLSMGLLSLPPAPGEWSALGCLQHLVDTERWVFPVRVRALLAGQDFAAYDPDSQGTKSNHKLSAVELAAEFAALRADSLALFGQITPSDLTRQARHQELGLVTLSELLHEWAGHDLMHLVQAERALMQPFIQDCGPWQAYFQDHIAGNRATS